MKLLRGARKGKSFALKSTQKRSSSSKTIKASEEIHEEKEPSNDKDDEDEYEITHLVKKISKAQIKRKKKKGFVPKKGKKGKAKQNKITCYECKVPGHLRFECPKLKKNLKKKAPKKKTMMAI